MGVLGVSFQSHSTFVVDVQSDAPLNLFVFSTIIILGWEGC